MDKTENIRRAMVQDLNTAVESDDKATEFKRLQELYGADNVWDTSTLQATFEVLGFMAPFCAVKRKSDGAKGAVMFQHMPRFYFDFKAT